MIPATCHQVIDNWNALSKVAILMEWEMLIYFLKCRGIKKENMRIQKKNVSAGRVHKELALKGFQRGERAGLDRASTKAMSRTCHDGSVSQAESRGRSPYQTWPRRE